MEERGHLEFLGVDGRVILEWIVNKSNWRAWTELNRLRIQGQWCDLWNAVMNFEFHNMRVIF
jgi:hypothetical protein